MDDHADAGMMLPDDAPPSQALELLVADQPERHDLVIGFVGAIGTPWSPTLRLFDRSLLSFGYKTEHIHVAGLLDDLDYQPLGPLPDRHSREYYQKRMDAGDALRANTKSGASMAALAVREIVANRSEGNEQTTPVAYLLHSLKHPDEVKLLRHVYGGAFSLAGVVSSVIDRRNALAAKFEPFGGGFALAESLIARDESDTANYEFGQNVRDTYATADVFIPSGSSSDATKYVDRYIQSLFGSPFLTPTQDEEGMQFAQVAALRSAARGRQVGAAVIPTSGTPVIAGTNEVPRPGGGQYWEGHEPDYRDFKEGEDPNPRYIDVTMRELFDRLKEHGWLTRDLNILSGAELLERARQTNTKGKSVLSGTRASALIEFTRCLHAEQAAIINAARAGVTTQGAILYTTTFPCHECAKLIIGAGIVEVRYIEPYPKSLVSRLYEHLIDTSPSLGAPRGLIDKRVPFHHFVGIAPRHYALAFTAGTRNIDRPCLERYRNAERLSSVIGMEQGSGGGEGAYDHRVDITNGPRVSDAPTRCSAKKRRPRFWHRSSAESRGLR